MISPLFQYEIIIPLFAAVVKGKYGKFPLDRLGEICYNIFMNKNGGEIMTDKIFGESENLEKTLERWLEYGMTLSITHEHAVNLAPICVKALEEVNAYRIYTLIELPVGVSITWQSGKESKLCPAYVIVYRFQLTNWIRKDWNKKDFAEAQKNKNPNLE
jgi:hypothetical protein